MYDITFLKETPEVSPYLNNQLNHVAVRSGVAIGAWLGTAYVTSGGSFQPGITTNSVRLPSYCRGLKFLLTFYWVGGVGATVSAPAATIVNGVILDAQEGPESATLDVTNYLLTYVILCTPTLGAGTSEIQFSFSGGVYPLGTCEVKIYQLGSSSSEIAYVN